MARNSTAAAASASPSGSASSGAASPDSPRSKATGNLGADLEAELASIRSEVARLAETIASAGSTIASDVKWNASAKAGEARQMSEDSIRELRRQVNRLEATVSDQVRDRPIMALAAAAGLGFIVALLARR